MKAVNQTRRLSCLLVISGLCCIASAARAAENAPLPTVHSVDLARYVGSWYEIALLPNRFSAEGRAKIVAASGNAKLRVTFFWPFYGDYWILALDDDYSEVLVGTPDRRYGWILARRPDLPEARAQALLVRARALGFDVAAFRRVPQIQPLDGAS